MPSPRPFALLDGLDAWSRAAHLGTTVDAATGAVQLAWTRPPASDGDPEAPVPRAAGLAFDGACRLYRSFPDRGVVTRARWRPAGAPARGASVEGEVELFEAPAAKGVGDFVPVDGDEAAPGPLREPRGLAVDGDDRLFVAETGAGRIVVHDLWSRRALRTLRTPPGTRPLDLASAGRTVLATVRGLPALLRLSARGEPVEVPLPPEAPAPERVAVSPGGRVAVLVGAGTEDALVVPVARPRDAFPVARATDLEWQDDEVLVVARRAGADLLRWRLLPRVREELEPLVGRGYDGLGIVRTPDGRIGYGTARGFRVAPTARVRHLPRGHVVSFRLDGGEAARRWGRVFVDACVPAGTSVRLWCAASDDDPAGEPRLPRTPPAVARIEVPRPDLSPPTPPLSLLPPPEAPGSAPEPAPWRPLHRRESGPELPWLQPGPEERFVTYEAPALADAGRWLWVALELRGTRHATPRVRTVRVERPGHDLVRRLPRTFSREPEEADFLRRYLAVVDGLLGEMEGRAARRDVLLDPWATPEEMLPWLAGFLGLALDERWTPEARRRMVAEAAWLFRFRGTVPGLLRMIEIAAGERPVLLEHFRLRGMGGALVGGTGGAESRAVLGGGFRVGGAVGDPESSPLEGTAADAFRTHAHRFTVVLRGALGAERLAAVRDLLEAHRPAHTVVELCTVDAGMRAGRGLHLGITSQVGRTGGWTPLQLGAAALGRGATVGRPEPGTRPGAARVGRDTEVG